MILRGRLCFILVAMTCVAVDAFLPTSISKARSSSFAVMKLNMNEDLNSSTSENQKEETLSLPQEVEPIRTIGGGADMIFEMARQMLLWDETEEYHQTRAAAGGPTGTSSSSSSVGGVATPPSTPATTGKTSKRKSTLVLPRWRPIRGVSDANPSFRTSAPMMNSQGYAGTIWRNVRKSNKPSLWRHALRTYDRMGEKSASSSSSLNPSNDSLSSSATTNRKLKVQRTNLHHEGALVACAKLGLWKRALEIYRDVEQEQAQSTQYRKVFVTDNMVLSLIRSCVRSARQERSKEPLDACVEALLEMEEQHGLPLVARHLNPLAAAYQKLGLHREAASLLQEHLEDRTSGPEDENGMDPFNVNDVRAKDKGSYSLLVKGAVAEGNWEGAVDALKTMTEAGLYPNARNLNAWTEVSERKTKQRATRSWKKKRNEYWMESVQ